ncbi:hypothetical protein UFOVP658_124 [uncultured Caudovirales phage]|uniref:Uncharacterized protein n=1 Tax=uncultured Caudovirales phage TaxID=2100421 RepID=A0A6J5NGT6_9CAUD|nr:hypothetical protein UFOVP658_124 [uncultured Caudovirales phage]
MTLENVANIRRAIMELDAALSEYINSSPEKEDAANVLLNLNLAKSDMGIVYDSFSHHFSSMINDKDILNLENGAQIEKKSSYDRKGWQHKELASAVVDKIIKMSVDMDTGEIVKTPQDVALDLMKYCAPSYWRIKELSSIGINADNYCEVGQLKTSVIVRKGDNK